MGTHIEPVASEHGAPDEHTAHRPRHSGTPGGPLSALSSDVPAGLVVFLVALPLCLGIALASGAPLASGLVAGSIGGLVVPLISRSALSVSGPAAGLAAIVAAGVASWGFPTVCAATVVGGVLQLALGIVRAGVGVRFVPSTVVRGMLAAIGLLLILKQLPHAIGYDHEAFYSEEFAVAGEGNTFSLLARSFTAVEPGAIAISLGAIAVLLLHQKTAWRRVAWLPGALVATALGTLAAELLASVPAFALESRHLVRVPLDASTALTLVDPALFIRGETLGLGVILGLVASLESLLSLDAIDRLDPYVRRSDPNRELIAQGVANVLSGLVGGLPISTVIVRSSVNVNAGAKTRAAAFFHGAFLLGAVLFVAPLLNRVPLAVLASILLLTGYKLATPEVFRAMWRRGWRIFLPFAVTVVTVLFTDLLVGILVGVVVGLVLTLREGAKNAVIVRDERGARTIRFAKDLYFFHKPQLLAALEDVPAETRRIVVDKGAADFVSEDIREALGDFETYAARRGITFVVLGVARPSIMPPAH